MTRPLAAPVSAIGLTPESTYLTVPVTATQIGVTTTNPARFQNVKPGFALTPVAKTQVPDNVDANFESTQHYHFGNTYNITLGYYLDPEELLLLARNFFGRHVQTTAAVANTLYSAAYKHVFYPNRKTGTFVTECKIEDGDYGLLASGCLTTGLDFTLGDMLEYDATIMAHAFVPNAYDVAGVITDYTFTSTAQALPSRMGSASTKTTTTPAFVTTAAGNQGNQALAHAGAAYGAESGFSSTFLSVNGSSFTTCKIMKGSKINLSRVLQSEQVLGSGRDPEALACTGFHAKGSLTITFEDQIILNAMLGHKKVALNVLYRGVQIGGSNTFSGVEFYIPNARLNGAPVPIGNGVLMANVDFDAIYDASAGEGIKMTLWNNTGGTASWGDSQGTYSGSLGGVLTS